MTVTEAYQDYINYYILRNGENHWTLDRMERYQRTASIFFEKNLEALRIEDIYRYQKHLRNSGRGQNTVHNYICSLRAVLRYHRIRGLECMNYELIPVPKRVDVEKTFCTSEEVARMVKCACNLRAQFCVSLLYASGIRLAELISLNRGSIQDREFTVIGKGNKPRLCFIDDRTEVLMERYLASRTDENPALLISHRNSDLRISRTTVQMIIRNAAKAAGIEKRVTPHTLRHSFATDLLRNGADIRYISRMLGHAHLNTTMIYTHLTDPDLKEIHRKNHKI